MKLILLTVLFAVAAQAIHRLPYPYWPYPGPGLRGRIYYQLEENAAPSTDDGSIDGALPASLRASSNYGIDKFSTDIKNIGSNVNTIIGKITNSTQRDQWQSIGDRIGQTSSAAQDLQTVNEQISSLETKIEDKADNTIDKWNDWADNIYDNLSPQDQKNKVIKAALNDFLDAYTRYLNECVNPVKKNLSKFNKKVEKAARNQKTNVKKLSKEVQQCLPSPTDACEQNVDAAESVFSDVRNDFQKLTTEGKALNVPYKKIECVKETLEEAENEQKELKKLIKKYVSSG